MLKVASVTFLLSATLLGGCSESSEETVRSTKGKMVERVEYLGEVEEAYWVNDETKDVTTGDEQSGSWQQGVARLAPAEFQLFRNSGEWNQVSTAPIIPAALKDKLTFGDTWSLGETDHGTFYLEADTHSVVFIVYD